MRFEGTKTKDENQRNLGALKSGQFFFGNTLLSRDSHSCYAGFQPGRERPAVRGTDVRPSVRIRMASGTITQAGVFKRKGASFPPRPMNATSTPRERHFPRPTKEMAAGNGWTGEEGIFSLAPPSCAVSSCWHVLFAASPRTYTPSCK